LEIGTSNNGTNSSFLGLLPFSALDDSDSDSLLHVTDGETTKRGILVEDLARHRLGRLQGDHSGITGLDELGELFQNLSRTPVNLGDDLLELAGNMGGMAIQHGGVAVFNLTGVVQNDNLSEEGLNFFGRIVLGVTSDVSSADILDRQTLDVESDVVAWDGLLEGLMMHFDGLDVGRQARRSEGNVHSWLEDTGLDTSDWDGTDTTDLVDVLKGDTKGLLSGPLGRSNGVQSLNEGGSLVPAEVSRLLEHVISDPTRDGDEEDVVGVVADLLEEVGNLTLDFEVPLFRVVDGLLIHLVDADDHLLDTKGEGEKSVLAGLTVLRDTSLELTLR